MTEEQFENKVNRASKDFGFVNVEFTYDCDVNVEITCEQYDIESELEYIDGVIDELSEVLAQFKKAKKYAERKLEKLENERIEHDF